MSLRRRSDVMIRVIGKWQQAAMKRVNIVTILKLVTMAG